LKRAREACFHARAVQLAPFSQKQMKAIPHFMSVIGTGDDALTAGDTSFGIVAKLRLRVLSFRIMAPETVHGASLQKHSGTDAWAVVQRKALYVENNVSNIHDNTVRRIRLPA
jgi:hypothetical protein